MTNMRRGNNNNNNATLQKGDSIVVVAGKYKGQHGTFIETATILSHRVMLNGKTHTLRRTSIQKEEQQEEEQQEERATIDEVLNDIASLEESLRKLKLKVETLKTK
jgi:ribosomal protein L24